MKKTLGLAALALAVAAPAVQAQVKDTGSFLVRLRATHLDSSNTNDGQLKATLTSLGSSEASINNKWLPELDISYFFTPNVAVELILTYPQKQDLSATNLGVIGTFKHLPPTLSLQYHVTGMGSFRPYVGLGVNYTNISAVDILDGAVGLKHNSLGLAAQVGADIPLGGGWLINLDAKKVQIGTKVYLSGADKGKFKVDPTLLAIGVGKRF